MPLVSSMPMTARLTVRLVFMLRCPLLMAASHGHLSRIVRRARAESMGHLTHFGHLPAHGLRCAALNYDDLVTRLLVASRNPKKLAELRRGVGAAPPSGFC